MMEVKSLIQDSREQNRTRSSVKSFKKHWLFGDLLEQLDLTLLPTKLDILKNYFYLKSFLLHLKNTRKLTDDEKDLIYESLVRETCEIWRHSSIPIIEEKYVKKSIIKVVQKAEYLASRRKSDRETDDIWIQQTVSDFNELLDCARCRCFTKATNFDDIDSTICKCEAIAKIPHFASKDFTDLQFYVDQKTTRKLRNGSTDIATSKKIFKIVEKFESQKRKAEEKSERVKRQKIRENSSFDSIDLEFFEPVTETDDVNVVDDNQSEVNQTKIPRNHFEFEESIEVSRRYGISLNATTALMNAHTNDLSKILGFSPEQYYVSQTKMSNSKSKYGEKMIASHEQNTKDLVCIGFDGKKGKSKIKNSREITIEKVSVNSHPGAKYVDHFIPKNSTGFELARELLLVLKKYKSKDTLLAMLCDGCRANTGHTIGAFRYVELDLARPLQHIVCLLHENELPLRHLFETIDGKSSGPDSFTGYVGKQIGGKEGLVLKSVEESSKFKRVPGKVPKIDFEIENNDLKYLYKICHLVQDGPENGDLSVLNEIPGKLHGGRWVTLFSWIVRLYCQTKRPVFINPRKRTRSQFHEKLLRLVRIILNLYAPMALEIRHQPNVTNGAKHLFKQLSLARDCLIPKEFKVFREVFENNCYFAHPEAILLSAMFDDDLKIRQKALKFILEARKRAAKSKKFRKYMLPKKFLNFEASNYFEMIHFDKMKPRSITEPPLLKTFSNDDLRKFAEGSIEITIGEIPCHSQSVERLVAITSKAAASEIGQTNRHSHIINMEKSCAKIPTRFSKKDFCIKRDE